MAGFAEGAEDLGVEEAGLQHATLLGRRWLDYPVPPGRTGVRVRLWGRAASGAGNAVRGRATGRGEGTPVERRITIGLDSTMSRASVGGSGPSRSSISSAARWPMS